jgi:hypothetical protein
MFFKSIPIFKYPTEHIAYRISQGTSFLSLAVNTMPGAVKIQPMLSAGGVESMN